MTLKAARVNVDMTAKEVADIVGIHQQTLLKYEHDSSKIPFDLLQRLSKIYGISTDYIFLGKKYDLKRTL